MPATRVQVDWSRFHLQLLFVDVEDMGNARLAQGLFDKTAAWNGYGRSLYAWTCGTCAQACSPERSVSLMMRAESLGASSKDFSRVPEQLETGDLYTYDMIIAMDASVRDAALEIFEADLAADWDNVEHREFYRQRVCTLQEFLSYASDEQLGKRGGTALLPRRMADMVAPEVARLRRLPDIDRAALSDVQGWNDMTLSILLGTAGLVQYLMDSMPSDLEYFWLE